MEYFFTPFFLFLFTPRENNVINKQKAAHTVVYHFPHFAFCLSSSAFCQGLGQGRSNVSCCSYYMKCSHCTELVIVFKTHCVSWGKRSICHYKRAFILKGWRLILQSLSSVSNSDIRFSSPELLTFERVTLCRNQPLCCMWQFRNWTVKIFLLLNTR